MMCARGLTWFGCWLSCRLRTQSDSIGVWIFDDFGRNARPNDGPCTNIFLGTRSGWLLLLARKTEEEPCTGGSSQSHHESRLFPASSTKLGVGIADRRCDRSWLSLNLRHGRSRGCLHWRRWRDIQRNWRVLKRHRSRRLRTNYRGSRSHHGIRSFWSRQEWICDYFRRRCFHKGIHRLGFLHRSGWCWPARRRLRWTSRCTRRRWTLLSRGQLSSPAAGALTRGSSGLRSA